MYKGHLSLSSGIITMNDKCIIQSVDKAACSIFERPLDAMLGQNIKILIPSPYREQHDSYVSNYLRTGERRVLGQSRLVEGQTASNSIFPLRLNVNEVFVDDQRVFVGVVDRLEDTGGSIKATEDGTIVSVSNGIERIFGYTAAELIGSNVSKLMPEPYASRHDVYLARWRASFHGQRDTSSSETEYQVLNRLRNLPGRRKDGEVIPLSLFVSLVETEGGHPWLHASIEMTDTWVVFTVRRDGIIESVAQTYAKSTVGRLAEQVRGRHISDLLIAGEGTDREQFWKQSGIFEMQHSDGSVVPVDVQVYEFGDDEYSVMMKRRRVEYKAQHYQEASSSSSFDQSGGISTSGSSSLQTDDFTPLSGGFVLGKKIGRGNGGSVRLAHHPITNSTIAVKISLRERSSESPDSDRRNRLEIELQTLKLLEHPYITKFIDAFTTPTKSYLLMDYHRGGELGNFLRQFPAGGVPWATVRRIFSQLVSAVAYCHSMNVIHRDLSLQNVMLDAKLDVRLVDFGLCAHIDNTTLRSTFCGTPKFASPEMVLGKKYLGPSVDVWSLGVIFFYMLSGTFPFSSVLEIITCQYTIPGILPREFIPLFRKIFIADPEHRATTGHILYHRLLDADILAESLPGLYKPEAWAAEHPTSLEEEVEKLDESLPVVDEPSPLDETLQGMCPFASMLGQSKMTETSSASTAALVGECPVMKRSRPDPVASDEHSSSDSDYLKRPRT